MRAAYDLKKNGLSNLLIEDIFHTFETWPSEDALIRLIKEEVKKYRAFTQTKNENNNKQENLQADNNEINKNLRLEMIILYCKDANTIHDPTTRLLCHAVANVYLLNEKHEKSAIFSTDTLMITQQKDAFHDYLRRKISDVKREMEKMEKKSASFFQRQMELVGYMYLEDKIEEAPFKDTLQEIFPHSVFTQSICIEDVNNNHPFYLQEVLVEKLAELQSKLNEVEIDKCKELHYKKWILTAEQVDFLYQTIDEISRDLSCSFYHTNRNGLSKEEIFNRALQTLGIKAHDISISADNCYHFSIRQKCIDKIKQLLAAANAAVILQKGIFGTPMIKHIKIIENKKGEPALQLNLVSHIDPYYFHQWKMNQIRKEFDVNKKDQSGEMHELENCWNIIPLNVLHRIVAHHALAEDEKKRLHTKANSIPFVSIEKDPIAHPLVQDILFHLQNMPIDKDLLYKIIEDYFINNTNDYGNKYTNGCQNGKKIWKRLLNHCEACLKKPDLQPNDQLVYRAICNYRALLPLWPEIQTMDELFIAQEKLEFISFFQKNAPFQAEANVFTAYHQTHAHGFSLVTNKHLSEHATAAKNDICEQIRGSDIYTTLNDIIEKDSLFLAAAFYSKEKKKLEPTLLDILQTNDQQKLQSARAFLNIDKDMDKRMNEIEEKKAQRVIACLRGEVERQFSKEYGLYYKSFKSIFITRNPQRNQLVKSIENIFNQALKERWALHTIKTALNNIADEAQSHHRSRSGTRLLGCLVNATCDFKLTMSKVLAKFPHTGEAINEKGESFNKSWRKI